MHEPASACDGVGGALGHPRVWMEMGEDDFVECGYCDRRFVLVGRRRRPEDERLAPASTKARPGIELGAPYPVPDLG